MFHFHGTSDRHAFSKILLVVVAATALYACTTRTADGDTMAGKNRKYDDAGAPESTSTTTTTDDATLPAPSADAGPPPATLPTESFQSAQNCGACHASIVKDWQSSMHNRALTSPLMIAETNQGIRGPYAEVPGPDPKRICVNCHSPSAARVTTSATLPLGDASTLNDEGVSCQTCHQFNGTATAGGGGYSTAYMAGLDPGNNIYGPLTNPGAGAPHNSKSSDTFDRPNTMCGNCHDVNYDRDHNGVIEKGADLVLQQTWDEYVSDYKAIGGTETCISCHMPVLANRAKAVDNNPDAPDRTGNLHDHSFVGVDYSLSDTAQRDATRAKRTALLQSAAKLEVDPASLVSDTTKVAFTTTITNSGSGHNLPTGFAFVRQMWLEVTAKDAVGNVVATSGVLASPSDDLCENELLSDGANPLSSIAKGCTAVDPNLVTFQLKLVDAIEVAPDANGIVPKDQLGQPLIKAAGGSREVLLQLIPAGVVPRKRPFDGIALGTLRPFEARSFNYSLPITGNVKAASVTVRLLFRNAAPYFVRGLAAGSAQDVPNLANLADNLEVVEMNSVTTNLP